MYDYDIYHKLCLIFTIFVLIIVFLNLFGVVVDKIGEENKNIDCYCCCEIRCNE